MKLKLLTGMLATFTLIIIVLQSCSKQGSESGSGGGENESGGGSSAVGSSHNMGQNCMNCHHSGGPGEGIFNVAGTVYDSSKTNIYSGATVSLYTGPNGTGSLKYTLKSDATGNFYTTQNIDFSTALYPAVQGKIGINYMSSSITIGQCNGCHGVTTNKIYAQ